MKKKLTPLEKLMKANLSDMRLKRIPRKDNKVKPIFKICGLCKKNPVTDHHFLCNKCWLKKKNAKSNK